MAKTRANLAVRALQKLQVIGSGQSAEAEDQDTADDAVDAVLADLSARNVYNVTDEDDIDEAAFEWLAIMLADAIAEDFGRQMDPGKREYAENKLRRIDAADPTYEVMKSEYF